MRLILLPGMDGSGDLFQSFVENLSPDLDTQIIPLPLTGDQDFESLTAYVTNRLPSDTNYYILAESFSGRIAGNIAASNPPNLRGLIFAASFFSKPNKVLLSLSRLDFAIKIIKSKPAATMASKILFPRNRPSARTSFQNIMRDIPAHTLKMRLQALRKMSAFVGSVCVPVLYLQASKDLLVSRDKAHEIEACAAMYQFSRVSASHFILQSQPTKCAALVSNFIDSIESSS